jgi:hypothetical protein
MSRPTPPNYERPCRSGRHTIPAGVMGCQACNRLSIRKKRTTGGQRGVAKPTPIRIGVMPPDDVIDGAACGPETAHLFDPMERGDEERGSLAERERIKQAREICQRCPVIAACLADAIDQRRVGMWGGTYLSPKWYEKRRSEAVVQKVKSA